VEDKTEAEAEGGEGEGEGGILKRAVDWINAQLSRTIFKGVRFILPKRALSPFAFLGMLTAFCFVLLSVTGIYLMFYYEPTFEGAYDSVARINDEVPYGFVMRNIHYHASNAMVFLAVAHLFYLFFKGRYKLRNKLMWIGGVVLGVLTVLEAFTGYSCIMNERAMFAMSIAQTLAEDMNPAFRLIAMGSGSLSEFVLRFYSLHVIVVPAIMILLMVLHFPRNLVLDVPVLSAVAGVILIIAGLFPVELGKKFATGLTFGVTVPEWYLAGIYSFLRTGIDRDLAALILPLVFVAIMAVIPFVDRGKAFRVRDRPLMTALGVAFLCQILLTTIWGSRSYNLFSAVTSDADIPMNPIVFWPTFIGAGVASFWATYLRLKRGRPAAREEAKPKAAGFYLLEGEGMTLVAAVIVVQAVTNYFAFQAYSQGMWERALIGWGAALLALTVSIYGYRISRRDVVPLPRGRQEAVVPSLKKAIGALIALQIGIVAYTWLLSPIPFANQLVTALTVAAVLMILATVVYMYRVLRRLTAEDYEWLAVGFAATVQLLLLAVFT